MSMKVYLLSILAILLSGCVKSPTQFEFSPLALSWGFHGSGHPARSSSYDRTGGNLDAIKLAPGETATLADIDGPGIIRRIWITTNAAGPIGRTTVLRFYWDGSNTPAVEVPLGDFFGIGNGLQDAEFSSWPITVTSQGRSRNCWWPMPFESGARITVTNEGPHPHNAFYFHIDYLALDDPPPTSERFYANYRQSYPTDFGSNHIILETHGKGHYVGCVLSVYQLERQWWGEGDEVIEIDGYEPLYGTGSEEYFGDAWGIREHTALWHGVPLSEGFAEIGQRSSMYRFHILDPYPFSKTIKVSIEHGTENDRVDNIATVAFWYQVPDASPQQPLPDALDRLIGDDRTDHLRLESWTTAMKALSNPKELSSKAIARLDELYELSQTDANKELSLGMIAYVKGLSDASEANLNDMEKHYDNILKIIDEMPDEEKYKDPTIKLATDDDNLIASAPIKARELLERVIYDMQRRVALKRGFEPGDELLIESRTADNNITPAPTYEDTDDFTYSYGKVDDPHLMGIGARFTYGNADPSWARFTPDFPVSGQYEVLVIFSYGSNAADTRYEVNFDGGKDVVPLQQRGRPGTAGRNNRTWHSLGTYPFKKGQDAEIGSVTLNAAPGTALPDDRFEYRAYSDAVRFIYRGE